MSKSKEEIAKRFNIDLKKLEEEQKKLAKLVVVKDSLDIEGVRCIAGIDVTTIGREVVASIATVNPEFEVIEEKFASRRASFPYVPGFLAFRELQVMIDVYKKLDMKPDVTFVIGHGILHPRGCGIASHFGIAIQGATIGVAKELLIGEGRGDKVYIGKKVMGALVETKKDSKPLIVSVGHNISLKSAIELVKKFSREPHKFPEPITLAHKFLNGVKGEFEKGTRKE